MHYTLCDMLTDLTQNAIEAHAEKITVEIYESETELKAFIRDNGVGMSPEVLNRVKDPFYTDGVKHPKRKVGLGIPFLIQTATETGGEWDISSVKGKGTTVYARFDLSNIDTPPVGDVPGFFRQILIFPGDYELEIIRSRKDPDVSYTLFRSEICGALGGFETAGSLSLLGDFLKSQEEPDSE